MKTDTILDGPISDNIVIPIPINDTRLWKISNKKKEIRHL